jgi:hypothetical protein
MITHPLCAKLLEAVCFRFLLLELLDLPRDPTAFREIEGGILCRSVLLGFRAFVLRGKFKGAADLFDEARQVLRRL